MASFKDIFKKLFGKEEDSQITPSNQPLVHEVIEREPDEKAAYETWKKSKRMSRALQFSQMEYHKNVADDDNMLGSTFYTINKPGAEGFILNFREDMFSKLEFQHYFDYMKERMLELNYKLYTSDRRSFNRQEFVETIERHYLKPRYQINEEQQFIQQFGNVIITQVKKDDQPAYIQFMCNRYQDHKYTEHEDFRHLMDHVLHDV